MQTVGFPSSKELVSLTARFCCRPTGHGCNTRILKTALYQDDKVPGQLEPQQLTFIPWFSWANRGEGEMWIWVNER
ncbi:hypothetical protein [Bradyrhizobium sp. LMG 9283]|uniref:hypothetical protein n=1 Tax=Bradyrhizobium sp. LMG 9283 TaxID=592064 RepID=UPI00388EA6A1